MKTSFIILTLLCFSLRLAGQADYQQYADRMARQYLADHHNRSLVVGIISSEGNFYFTYGETEKGNGIKPDTSAVFGISEATSVFMTALLSRMDSENLVDLNDPVQNYFPGHVHIPIYTEIICEPLEQPHYQGEQRTHTAYYCFADPSYHPRQMLLCDLATNTSGLPAYPDKSGKAAKGYHPYSGYQLTDLYDFLNKYQAGYATGLHYKFSPLGLAILGQGLAWKSGTPYSSLLQNHVLDPLQLRHTFFHSGNGTRNLIISGHDKQGKKVAQSDFGALEPALGLYSNAHDLAAFVRAVMQLPNNSETQPFANTANPRVAITDDKKLRGSFAGLGWVISPVDGDSSLHVTWQQGHANGYASYIGFIAGQQCGVVVLSNSENEVAELGKGILLSLPVNKAQPVPESINH